MPHDPARPLLQQLANARYWPNRELLLCDEASRSRCLRLVRAPSIVPAAGSQASSHPGRGLPSVRAPATSLDVPARPRRAYCIEVSASSRSTIVRVRPAWSTISICWTSEWRPPRKRSTTSGRRPTSTSFLQPVSNEVGSRSETQTLHYRRSSITRSLGVCASRWDVARCGPTTRKAGGDALAPCGRPRSGRSSRGSAPNAGLPD